MLRTRDFILYVLVLLFLLVGTVTTSIVKPASYDGGQTIDFQSEPGVAVNLQERDDTGTSEQEDTLARLRAKLAAGEGERISAPPVFTSVDTPTDETVISEATTTPSRVDVQYCSSPSPHRAEQLWPTMIRTAVTEVVVELLEDRPVTRQVGSSTVTEIESVIFLTLPRRSVRSNFDTCLPDSTIGVTTTGAPLNNQSAHVYQQFQAQQPVGYTRDGFTLFGPAAVEATLDSCNGQYVNGVYQYHVSRDSDVILPCYAGVPVALPL